MAWRQHQRRHQRGGGSSGRSGGAQYGAMWRGMAAWRMAPRWRHSAISSITAAGGMANAKAIGMQRQQHQNIVAALASIEAAQQQRNISGVTAMVGMRAGIAAAAASGMRCGLAASAAAENGATAKNGAALNVRAQHHIRKMAYRSSAATRGKHRRRQRVVISGDSIKLARRHGMAGGISSAAAKRISDLAAAYRGENVAASSAAAKYHGA